MINNISDNSKSRKIKKSFITYITLFIVSIISLFTFTACKLTSSSTTGSSAVRDANGALRLSIPFVWHNTYSVDGSGKKVIDDVSGSFSWELDYYVKNADDEHYDQTSYEYCQFYYVDGVDNFIVENMMDTVETDSEISKPIYAKTVNALIAAANACKSGEPINSGNIIFVEGKAKNSASFSEGWWQCIPVVGDDVIDYMFCRVYTYTNYETVNASTVAYPDFEVVVDGNFYTFKVECDYDKLGEYSAINARYGNMFQDISGDGTLFTFKYRNGKSTSEGQEFKDCPAGFMTYYVQDGKFYIRFNPHLEKGATNRYLKVRALLNSKDDDKRSRATSLYSSTLSFEAYAVSFEAYSPNSVEIDYGGIDYDHGKYYFVNEKSVYDSKAGLTYIKSITGYFPEGRKIEVKRGISNSVAGSYNNTGVPYTTTYNYAFQSWTANAKADNTNAIERTLPYRSIANDSYYVDSTNLQGFTIGENPLNAETTAKSSQFKSITIQDSYSAPTYQNKAYAGNELSDFAYDCLPERDAFAETTDDRIVVTAHRYINGYKFYANFAKVRDFEISGTMFAGDNFFTGDNQYLTGFTPILFVYIGEGQYKKLVLSNVSKIFSQNELGFSETTNSHINGVKLTINGSYFKVEGLEYNDYIIFEKEGAAANADAALNAGNDQKYLYSFHSPMMVNKFVEDYGTQVKALQPFVNSLFFGDKQDLGVIGTQYSEDSNLIVNLYSTVNDSENNIADTGIKLLENTETGYEIIKSVSTYEDKNGYVTTNVIISLMLPSNQSLVGYNVETMNNLAVQYFSKKKEDSYTKGDSLYVVYSSFNREKYKYEHSDFYGNLVEDGVKIKINSNAYYEGEENDKYKIYTIDDYPEVNIFFYEIISNTIISKPTETTTSAYIVHDGHYWKYMYKNNDQILPGTSNGDTVYYYMQIDENQDPFVNVDGTICYDAKDIKQIVHIVGAGGKDIWKEVKYVFSTYKYKEELDDSSSSQPLLVSSTTTTIGVDTTEMISDSVMGKDAEIKYQIKTQITKVSDYETLNSSEIANIINNIDGEDLYDVTSKITLSSKDVSVVVDAYKTEMRYINSGKEQDVYVCYDVKKVDGKAYYISPVAFSNGDSYKLLFSEISNFGKLKDDNKIMLGSEIIKVDTDAKRDFYRAIGAKVSATAYYYIAPIGEIVGGKSQSTTLLAKQYLVDEDASKTKVIRQIDIYKDKDGNVFTGQVLKQIDESALENPKANVVLSDESGMLIDDEHTDLKIVNGKNSLTSLSGDSLSIDALFATSHNMIYNTDDLRAEKDGNLIKLGNYEETVKVKYEVFDTYQGTSLGVYGDNSIKDIKFVTSNSSGLKYNYQLYLIDFGENSIDVITVNDLYFDRTTNRCYNILGTTKLYDEYGNLVEYAVYDEYTYYQLSFSPANFAITPSNALLDQLKVSAVYNYSVIRRDESGKFISRETATKNYYGLLLPTYHFLQTDAGSGEIIDTQYFLTLTKDNKNTDPKLVYNFSMNASANYKYYKAVVKTNEDGSYEYEPYSDDLKLTYEMGYDYIYVDQNGIIRDARKLSNSTVDVTILGKYISSNDPNSPTIYPSFSSLIEHDPEKEDMVILSKTTPEEGGGVGHYNYYSLDYTTTNTVKEGFPGIILLSGTPYPNPVLYLSVRHLASETPVINISFDIKPAYYVEILGSNIQTDDSNLIRDFTTFSFKDTITNLTQNDYLDNTYYVIDKETLSPVIPYYSMSSADYNKLTDAEKNKLKTDVELEGGTYYFFYTYTTSQDESGNYVYAGYPLTIQDIGLNEDEMLVYFKDSVAANGSYTKKVYVKYFDEDNGSIAFKTIDADKDVTIWSSSPSKIENVPVYDIHTYYQDLDGIIYFTSGTDTDDNVECIGLSGISAGATKSEYGYYNYDNVVLGGVTYAYRTLESQINGIDNYGYQFDKQISIVDAFDSKNNYFLTGIDAAVIMASPIVQVDNIDNNSYIYRFKEWKVYSRYNSEVLYYNQGITSQLQDSGQAYNAILQFSSLQAGYFVILPVYQRVYKIDLGTAVLDGPINQGGGVTVLYSTESRESDIEKRENHDLYMVEYLKTEYLGKQGYYYGNLTGIPYIYFTGSFTTDVNEPIFIAMDNVYYINNDFYEITSGNIQWLNNVSSMTEGKFEAEKKGIVWLTNINGQYAAYYNTQGNTPYIRYFNEDSEIYTTTGKTTLKELLRTTFTAKFFFDTLTGEDSSNKTVPVYYNKDNMTFSSFSTEIVEHTNKYKSIKSFIIDDIAIASTNTFTSIPVADPSSTAGMYRSKFGTFASGELAVDGNGQLYSTQQFKTTYIDRDAYVKLIAVPDNGYRVEGWYKCYYDEVAKVWITTEDKVVNSDAKYFDEIIQAYYNKYTSEYYYITDYYTVGNVDDDIRYYYDSDKTKLTTVPERMLDKVRGYFVNMGSNANPNWIQVYSNRNTGYERFYFDPDFTNRVDLNVYDVQEMTLLSAIHNWDDGLVTLSNVTIYKRVIDPDTDYEKIKYYRGTSQGNIRVDGNTLEISDLHSNLRYVAKFIETYNEYIYTEDTQDGISISAVYYYNNDRKIEKDEDNKDVAPTIRSNHYGDNKTSLYGTRNISENSTGLDYVQNNLEQELFALDKPDQSNPDKPIRLLSADNMNKIVPDSENIKYYEGISQYTKLINEGFGAAENTYRVNEYDSDLGGNIENDTLGKLNLKSMYFDVNTTVYIIVRVPTGDELSMHTLGMNRDYVLNPVVYPTESYIAYNEKTDKENKVDYIYYIFSVTYNRDPENEYVNYIAHPKRGDSVAYDALAGNYIDFYGNYFDYYDSFGNKIGYEKVYDANHKRQIKLTNAYIRTLLNQNKISQETYDKIVTSQKGYGLYERTQFDNIAKALESLNFERHNYDDLKIDYISFKAEYVKEEDVASAAATEVKTYVPAKEFSVYGVKLESSILNNKKFTGSNDRTIINKTADIDSAIEYLIAYNRTIKENDIDKYPKPYLVKNGQRNFVNLSSLVIYTYTVQVLTIDDYEYDATGTLIQTDADGKVILDHDYNQGEDFDLANSVYVDAGMNGKTFVGTGEKASNIYTYMDHYNDATKKQFEINYTGLEYGVDETPAEGASDNKDRSVMPDLGFVENTIVLFEGVKKDETYDALISKNYAFVGWFEQKYDRVTKSWTNLELMSQDEQYPYLSLATEDTIIVAVYKRVVDVTITYDKEEVTLQLPSGYIDSLGNTLTIEDKTDEETGLYDHTELYGTFFFDTDFGMYLTLAGGYRFDGFGYTYNYYDKNGIPQSPSLSIDYKNSCLSYKEYTETTKNGEKIINYVDKTSNNVKLNGALYVSAPLAQTIIDSGNQEIIQESITSTTIDVRTKKLTLLYVEVENYNKDTGVFAGLNFELQNDGIAVLKTKSSTKVSGFTVGKDDRNQKLNVKLDNTKLIISGYFDNDKNLKMITTAADNTVDSQLWYINGCQIPTNAAEYDVYNLNETTTNEYYRFNINFEYAAERADLNSEANFALDRENAVYYMHAIIKENHHVNIVHTINDDISSLGTKSTQAYMGQLPSGINSDVALSVLSYNGILYDGSEVSTYTMNNSKNLTMNTDHYFAFDAEFNVYVKYDYIFVGNNLYKFVGWFASKSSYAEGTLLDTLITTEKYFTPSEWYTTFEAKYVKVDAVFVNTLDCAYLTFSASGGENGDITAFGVVTNEETILNVAAAAVLVFDRENNTWTTAPDVNSHVSNKYVLNGATLSATISPDTGYIVDKFNVVYPSGLNNNTYKSNNENVYSVSNVGIDSTKYINLNVDINKGYVLTINQLSFDNVNMNGDGKIISGSQISLVYNGKTSNSIESRTLRSNEQIILKNRTDLSNYYFMGFYINGVLVSGTDTSYTLTMTEDVVFEARFIDYIYLKVNSYLYGTTNTITSSYQLTYNDPLTGDVVSYSLKNENKKIPAGITGHFKLNSTTSTLAKFVGFGLVYGANVRKIYSSETIADITINKSDATSNIVNVAILYQYMVNVKVNKQINISNVDKTDSNYYNSGSQTKLFKSLFDVKITYYDINNNLKVVTMGSYDSISNISAKYKTSMSIEVLIDESVKDKYDSSLKGAAFTRSGNIYTISEVVPTLNIDCIFDHVIKVQVNKEIDGIITNNSNVSVNTDFYDMNGWNIYSTWDGNGSSDELTIPYNSYYDLQASSNENFEFVGWYIGSDLLSTEAELSRNNSDYMFTSNVVLTAKFASSRSINVYRYVSGNPSENNNMEISLTGQIKTEAVNGVEFNVKTHSIEENENSLSAIVLYGSNIVLQATHIDGYIFKGFKINSLTSEYITATEHSYLTTALTQVTGNINVYAIYEKAYTVSYVVSTIVGEDQSRENGASISNPTLFYSESDTSISFNIDIQSGYSIHAIYMNGNLVEGTFTSGAIAIGLPSEQTNIALEIRVKKTLNLDILVAVNESADKNVLSNQFGIDLSKLYINFNGVKYYLNNITTATLMKNFDITLNSDYSVSAGIDGDSSLTPSFIANGIRYYFNGLYIYDGTSVATSVAPISYKNAINFTASKNLSIVAKFADTEFGYDTQTKLTYEFMTDLTANPIVLTEYDGVVDTTTNHTMYNSNQYIFIGYYGRINDVVNGVQYIKLTENYNADLSSYDGIYANIVARFMRIYSKQITVQAQNQTIASVSYLSSQVFAKINSNTLCPIIENNDLKITRLASSALTLTDYVIDGFYIDDGGTVIYSRENVYSSDLASSQTIAETVVKIAVDTTIDSLDNSITGVTASQNTLETDNELTIDNVNTTAHVIFAVSDDESIQSSLIIAVYDPSDPETTISETVVYDNEYDAVLSKGQIIHLTYLLASQEEFLGYDLVINGVLTHISSNDYTYVINSDDEIVITALFRQRYELTLINNDVTKGNVNISTDVNGNKTLQVVASENYAISSIEFALIQNGVPTGSYYNILTDITADSMFESVTKNSEINITNAKNTKTYKSAISYTFALKQNVAVIISYVHVTKMDVEILAENMLKTTYSYIYFATDSPLTLVDIQNLDLQSRIESDGFNYYIYGYQYAGEEIDGTTEIAITTLDKVIIAANCVKAYKVQLHISTLDDDRFENSASKAGLNIRLDSDVVVTGSGNTNNAVFDSEIITYYIHDGKEFTAYDDNNNYEFIGYFKEVYTGAESQRTLTTSPIYKFTNTLFSSLTPDASGVYHIYAGFKEKVDSLIIETNYISEFGDSFKLTLVENDPFIVIEYEEGLYFVSYISSALTDDEISVTANGFTTNTSDPLLSFYGATKFYEHTHDGERFRFTNFYDIFADALGTRYDNQISFNLNKLSNTTIIVASVERLSQIQYTYDVANTNIKISLDAYAGVNSTYNSDEISNKTQLKINSSEHPNGAILNLYVEGETAVRVNIDYHDYTGSNDFEYFAGRTSVLTNDISAASITNLSGLATLPYSAMFGGKNMVKSRYTSNGTSAYNFIVKHNTDMSFIADFGLITQKNKTIGALLYNSDIYNSCKILSKTLDGVRAVEGGQFGFFYEGTQDVPTYLIWSSSVKTGIAYTDEKGFGYEYGFADDKLTAITETIKVIDETTETEVEEQTEVEEEEEVVIENPAYKNAPNWYKYLIIGLSNLYKTVKQTVKKVVTSIKKVVNTNYIEGPGTEVHMKQTNIIMVNALQIPENPEVSAVKLIKRYDDLYKDQDLTYDEMTMPEGKSLTINSDGDYWTVTAPSVEGYFFKGFMIVSTGYSTSYPLVLLNGETRNIAAENYTFLGYTASYDGNGIYTSFTSNQIKKEYGVSIYAVYEARVYIITLNLYQYQESKDVLYYDTEDPTSRKECKMSMEEVYAGKITGALLVERDNTAALQASPFQFKQFVGWSTTKEYYNNDYIVLIDRDIETGKEIGITVSGEKVYSSNSMSAQYAAAYIEKYVNAAEPKDYSNGSVQYSIKSNAVTPGEKKENGVWTNEYYSSLAKNNLYIYKLQSDFALNAYFTELSYKLYITLTDLDTTATGDDGTSGTYLAYADWVRNQDGWKNPSAGTYEYSADWATDSRNNVDSSYTYKIIIEDNDPYVYVANDSNDNSIGYPTRIAADLVNVYGNEAAKSLNYKKSNGDIGKEIKIAIAKDNNTIDSYPARVPGSDVTVQKVLYKGVTLVDATTNTTYIPFMKYKDYLNNKYGTELADDESNIIADKYGQLYLYGFSENAGTTISNNLAEEINKKINISTTIAEYNKIFNLISGKYKTVEKIDPDQYYVLSYLYDYLDYKNGTWSLKDGLFTVTVDGTPLTTEEIKKDLVINKSTGAIEYVTKIAASSYGFPDVQVKIEDCEDEIFTADSIEEINFCDRLQRFTKNGLSHSEITTPTTNINFSNNGIYDLGLDETGDLSVRLLLKWKKAARKVTANVQQQVDGSMIQNTNINLTAGTPAYSTQNKTWLQNGIQWSGGDAYNDGQIIGNNMDFKEIQAYFVIIVENVYDIIKKLTEIAETTGNAEDRNNAVEYMGLILGNARTFLLEGENGQISGFGNGLTGQLFPDDYTTVYSWRFLWWHGDDVQTSNIREKIVNLINKYYSMNLHADEILKFHMIDVYEYYRRGISSSIMNNCCIHGNDMLINVCLLQEHHRDEYGISKTNPVYIHIFGAKIEIWPGMIWYSNRPYDFYRRATMTFKADNNNGAYTSQVELAKSYIGSYDNASVTYDRDMNKIKNDWNRNHEVTAETLAYFAYKYALDYRQSNSYMRVINASVFLNRKDFKGINSVVSTVSIDAKQSSEVVSYFHPYPGHGGYLCGGLPISMILIGLGLGAVSTGIGLRSLLTAIAGAGAAAFIMKQPIPQGLSRYPRSDYR